MTKKTIIESAKNFALTSPSNFISEEDAIHPNFIGMQIFDAPIFAFGTASDEIYESYKSPEAIGEHFLPPVCWLPSAKTVISYFIPYTEKIRASNRSNTPWPSDGWLHGRMEGQVFVKELSQYIEKLLLDAGYQTVVPMLDSRFKIGSPATKFTSNWSERHIAFACGLGTFGLSGGIITQKGMAGRLGSILTNLELLADARPYTETYEYCTMCGLCIPNCPSNAISFEKGKKHEPCSMFLDKVLEKHSPRYGCGKCQVNVPCESEIPAV